MVINGVDRLCIPLNTLTRFLPPQPPSTLNTLSHYVLQINRVLTAGP